MHNIRDFSTPIEGAGLPAFTYYDPYHWRHWAQIKECIASGVPVLARLYPGKNYPMEEEDLFKVSDREGHVVALVGYDDDTNDIIVADPWNNKWGGTRGGLTRINFDVFAAYEVNCTRSAISFSIPWKIELNIPDSVSEGEVFEIESNIHYTAPNFIPNSENHVHALHSKLHLPDGIVLVQDKDVKRVGDGYFQPHETKSVNWLVKCEKLPSNRNVEVSVKGIVSSMDPYPYSDILGAKQSTNINVKESSSVKI